MWKPGKTKVQRPAGVCALGLHELSTKGFKGTEIHGFWFRLLTGTPKLPLDLWASSLINSRDHQNHFRIPIPRANLLFMGPERVAHFTPQEPLPSPLFLLGYFGEKYGYFTFYHPVAWKYAYFVLVRCLLM